MAEKKFTKEQKSVIGFRGDSLLVSAAAGSGKTAVLVERILGLLLDEERPVSLDELIVMTFTKAAASEMKSRIAEAIRDRLSGGELSEKMRAHLETQRTLLPRAMISTIDSICQRFIRQYFQQLDIDPGFRVADEAELKLLRGDIMKKLLEEKYEEGDPKFLSLCEKYAGGGSEDRMSDLLERLRMKASASAWPEDFLEKCRKEAEAEAAGNLEKTEWFADLLKETAAYASESRELSARGKRESELPGGWKPYTPVFESLENFYAVLEETAEKGGREAWDSLHSVAAEKPKWDLPRVRIVPDSTPEEKKREQNSIEMLRDTGRLLCPFSVSYDELSERTRTSAEDCLQLSLLTAEYLSRFRDKKREMNLVDFADMEHMCLELLYEKTPAGRKPSKIADELAARFREIMIDEYQDSSDVQEELIGALSAARLGRPDVFMVGDVKQSIYSFREARPELFIRKHKGTENRVIELNRNFRSRPEVLYFVNDVFARIMSETAGGVDYDEEASLKTGRPDCLLESGDPVFGPLADRAELLVLDTEGKKGEETSNLELECHMIANRIGELSSPQAGSPVSFRDIAVLVRKNDLAEELLKVLTARGIPAWFDSGSGYFESPEVMLMLSFLAIIDNPVQDIPLAAVMRSPYFGSFTDDELGMIRAAGGSASYYDCLLAASGLASPLGEKCAAFLSYLNALRDDAARSSCHELIWRIYRESGIYEAAAALPDGVRRRKNLDLLLEKAENYAATGCRGLFHFNRYIEQLKKYKEDMGEASAAVEGQDIVTITTMHRSKGLQYPVTIVAFPERQFSRKEQLQKLKVHRKYGIALESIDLEKRVRKASAKGMMIDAQISDAAVGEEMRLLYVAMTRAENRLILVTAANAKDLPELSKVAAASPGCPVDFSKVDKVSPRRVFGWRSMLPMITESGALTAGNVVMKVFARETVDIDSIITEKKEISDEIADIKEIKYGNYPYSEETTLKPKVSVSEIKEKKIQALDEEFVRDLSEKRAVKGAEFGTKVHRAFEIFDYTLPPEEAAVRAADRAFHMDGIPTGGPLSEEEKEDASLQELYRSRDAALWILRQFIRTPLYETMRDAFLRGTLRREQHFMAGFPACELTEGAKSEELQIVQGIIDACIIEESGITLIDYKTDSIREEDGEQVLRQRYGIQLVLYARALAQLCRRDASEIRLVIYSTKLGREMEL